jgi:hypothetical protein
VHNAWGEDRAWVVGPSGVISIPASWTDAAPPDPFVVQSHGRAVVRLEDLLALVQLVRDLGC